ncbi:hypothetical protein METBIDRAFT_208435 [Metschnikowia bicuspidata var. bicuspidata NRRL YB-4993]|uniref:Altered inheritance of mitochondria protein 21 n=1 Tax=Metschnikowia bicuspidata var. bicuspidata NRRL YB-4993 TaxID=869754 RepID=A0A1A0H6U7_9ASCO|nr:hypothetical protein METBIDRAFT_208435 [Metschnikowia bicuspidata var. bicuspidata NRRL YB-4993]OBA19819.1 hypothetical protein METBIDRAFT_208435 [Metschnikowia bicuspidata var. bicuspidata NRRL YB-4993]
MLGTTSPVVPQRPGVAKQNLQSENAVPVIPARPRKQTKSAGTESANSSDCVVSHLTRPERTSNELGESSNSLDVENDIGAEKQVFNTSTGKEEAADSTANTFENSSEESAKQATGVLGEELSVSDIRQSAITQSPSSQSAPQYHVADLGVGGAQLDGDVISLNGSSPSSNFGGEPGIPQSELDDAFRPMKVEKDESHVPTIPARPKVTPREKLSPPQDAQTEESAEISGQKSQHLSKSGELAEDISSREPLPSESATVSASPIEISSTIPQPHGETDISGNDSQSITDTESKPENAGWSQQNTSIDPEVVSESRSASTTTCENDKNCIKEAAPSPESGLLDRAGTQFVQDLNALSQPTVPKRPSRASTTEVHNQEKKHTHTAVKDQSAEQSSLKTNQNNSLPLKKAPPAKPKKLSSKIAAFQQMFNQAPLEQTIPKIAPSERARLSSKQTSFASNLQDMMGRSLPLPGMANPDVTKKMSPAEDPAEIESEQQSESVSCSSIPRRARGPRGKRLPKQIQDTKIEIEPRFKICVSDVWEVSFCKLQETDSSDDVENEQEKLEDHMDLPQDSGLVETTQDDSVVQNFEVSEPGAHSELQNEVSVDDTGCHPETSNSGDVNNESETEPAINEECEPNFEDNLGRDICSLKNSEIDLTATKDEVSEQAESPAQADESVETECTEVSRTILRTETEADSDKSDTPDDLNEP